MKQQVTDMIINNALLKTLDIRRISYTELFWIVMNYFKNVNYLF